jgi:hypothetical protein
MVTAAKTAVQKVQPDTAEVVKVKAPRAKGAAPVAAPVVKAAESAPAKGRETPGAEDAPKAAAKKTAALKPIERKVRTGRPTPHDLDAKIKKGVKDFKSFVRPGSHRFAQCELLVKSIGKSVDEVLGAPTSTGIPLGSQHITAAVNAGYIELSK